MTAETELTDLAAGIAREAGELALWRREEGVHLAATKSSLADIVTEADREVEALVRARLREARPGDGFLGEESDADAGVTGITWVVDPIDGTVNYAYGIPAYAVSIAAVRGEAVPGRWEALAAAVFAPAHDELFTAARGEGAWRGSVRLAVTSATPAGALWDFAAGALLVAEAGGVVTRVDTASARPMLIAAGPDVHARLTVLLDEEA
ncbi:MAG: inositol monophosphatase [Microbacterium sp.]|uniref:inositol monophosphatase family protein n=1 Tax=Microbacterium sp. TaxID=51671 RepID=UPI001D466EF6|nr:inositol monophosphatase family protein [Microbacterium sp.]MBW8761817.1 inositol monophosphatase [Microbacterium sp.]